MDLTNSKILIVEDERITAEHIKQFLESLGYDVVNIVSTGERALEIILEEDVHLVLMDIKLKGSIDGIQTAERIQDLKEIPIIFLTAYTDDLILEKAKISDPFGYVLKPFGQKELKIAVTMALYKHSITASLKENEERYRSLVEASPNSIFIHQDGKILYANPAACRMGGASGPEELVGTEVHKHIHPDYLDLARKRMNEMLKTGNPTKPVNEKFIRLDGKAIDVNVTAIPFEWNKKPAIQVISREITGDIRIQAQEKAIRKISEAVHSTNSLPQLYNKIHHSISDFMYAENMFIALYNKSGKTLEFPYFVDSKDKTPPIQPFGTGLTEYVIKINHSVFVTREEIDYLNKNGDVSIIGTVPSEWIGVPLTQDDGILGIIAIQNYLDTRVFSQNDVEMLTFISYQIASAIKYKRTVDHLIESENKFRVLSESSSFGIFVYQKGRFKYVNPAMSEITGYSKSELLKIDVWSLVHPEHHDIIQRGMDRQEGMTLRPAYDFKIISKSGEERWCDFTAAIIDFEGIPSGLVTIVDISDRKKSEEALTRLNQAVKNTHDVIFMTDNDGIFTFVNPEFESLYGYSAEEVIGKATPGIISGSTSNKNYYKDLQESNLEQNSVTLEISKLSKAGDTITVEESIDPIYEKDKIVGFLSIQRNISERKMLESTFRDLGTGFAKLSGQEFFEKVSRHLTLSIGIDHAYVGQFRQNFTEVQVLGGWSKGNPIDLFRYELKGTPCDKVKNHDLISITSGFEVDKDHKKLAEKFRVEAYIGSPLYTSDGEPEGIIVLLNDMAIENQPFAELMLNAFSDRVGAEIERRKTEKELEKKVDDLARQNRAMIGRELKMIDLKKEINTLLQEQGKPPKYKAHDEN